VAHLFYLKLVVDALQRGKCFGKNRYRQPKKSIIELATTNNNIFWVPSNTNLKKFFLSFPHIPIQNKVSAQ
jgi:hypothetical protein